MKILIDIRLRTFFKIKNSDAEADADLNFSADDRRMRMWRTSLSREHRDFFWFSLSVIIYQGLLLTEWQKKLDN